MDVVVTPMGSEGVSWSLKDRLGRTIGSIARSTDAKTFEVSPEPDGGFKTVERAHPSLDDAMTAIAKHMRGACSLDSQDWD